MTDKLHAPHGLHCGAPMVMLYDGVTYFIRQCTVCGLNIEQDKRRPTAVARRVANYEAQREMSKAAEVEQDAEASPKATPKVDLKTGGGLL